jgi:uncharacterized protein YggE
MKEARHAAQELASLAGMEIGPAISIREAGAGGPGPIPMAMEARSGVPIEPGTSEVSYTVEVTYSLVPRRGERRPERASRE